MMNRTNAVMFGPAVPSHEEVATEIGRLVDEKNRAYGDSFARSGEVMRILYPGGIRPEQLDDALGIVRVVDKLFRLAHDPHAFGESPWRDISGYGILGAARAERGAKATDALDAAIRRANQELPLHRDAKV